MTSKDLGRYRGCLLGLAIGDALGTAVEFRQRGSFPPLTVMTGGGAFRLEPGQWTDDTSMALCLATSMVEKKGFDALDQMQRYLRWFDEGYLSSTGECFDIGRATQLALERFRSTGQAFSGSSDPFSAGNGSLMRLAPVALFYAPDQAQASQYAGQSSRTTHAAPECVQACQVFAGMLVRALGGESKTAVLFEGREDALDSEKILAIARGVYRDKDSNQIRGSGYVVESLEAALWCFWKTGSFSEAVLAAANLGDDADTTAAICGQIAGAYYGESGLPTAWLEKLYMQDQISTLAEQLANHA
jgi:ADP-ribosyl-[dinitrogen reductase] hydrolase